MIHAHRFLRAFRKLGASPSSNGNSTRHVGEPFDNVADMEDVISAYRLILGRNPEQSGFDHYRDMVELGNLSVDRLFSALTTSQEYKTKRGEENKILDIDCGGYYVCVKRGEKEFGSFIAEHKTWEPHIIDAIAKILKKGDTFIDIGANVGMMTFHAARLVGEMGKVVAVEPNPDNLQLLYRGIVKNRLKNVTVMPFAASDKVEIFSLLGGTSNTYVAAPEDNAHYVQSIVLDDELSHLDRIDFVKIDIEGHELYALNGFRRLLQRHKPLILMEFNPRCLRDVAQLNPRECLDPVFELLENVQTIEHSGKYSQFSSADELWAYWEKKNEEAVRTKWLADGMLHFDLLARAK